MRLYNRKMGFDCLDCGLMISQHGWWSDNIGLRCPHCDAQLEIRVERTRVVPIRIKEPGDEELKRALSRSLWERMREINPNSGYDFANNPPPKELWR